MKDWSSSVPYRPCFEGMREQPALGGPWLVFFPISAHMLPRAWCRLRSSVASTRCRNKSGAIVTPPGEKCGLGAIPGGDNRIVGGRILDLPMAYSTVTLLARLRG